MVAELVTVETAFIHSASSMPGVSSDLIHGRNFVVNCVCTCTVQWRDLWREQQEPLGRTFPGPRNCHCQKSMEEYASSRGRKGSAVSQRLSSHGTGASKTIEYVHGPPSQRSQKPIEDIQTNTSSSLLDKFSTIWTSVLIYALFFLLCLVMYIILPSIYVLLVVIPSGIGSTLVVLSIPIVTPQQWLGFEHERVYYWILIKMEHHAAEFYRYNILGLKELIELVTKDDNKMLSAHDIAAENREISNALQNVVQTQIRRVQDFIDGGREFIEVSETTNLSSVFASLALFVLYIVYFESLDFEIGKVPSKIHDGLAILLPLLLVEEIAAGLSIIYLLFKKFANKYRTPASLWTFIQNVVYSDAPHSDRTNHRENFSKELHDQSLRAGVGATSMKNVAAFVASLWTLLFLVQGYIVEELKAAEESHLMPNTIEQMAITYWFLIYFSGSLILFCFVPFFYKQRPHEQKEEFEAVSASCEAYLFINRMSKLQNQILRKLKSKLKVHFYKQSEASNTFFQRVDAYFGQLGERWISFLNIRSPRPQDPNDCPMLEEGSSRASMSQVTGDMEAAVYTQLQKLRLAALQNMDAADAIAVTLYCFALSTYNFVEGTVNGQTIGNFEYACESVRHLQQPVHDQSEFWSSLLNIYNPKVDQKPTILHNLPINHPKLEGWYKPGHEELLPPMTLFSLPVLGVCAFGRVLLEHDVTKMSTIYDNSIVQNKKIYISDTNQICIGLEINITKEYVVSIYIVSSEGSRFGHGLVFAHAQRLGCTLNIVLDKSGWESEFKEVREDGRLLAFAGCKLDLTDTNNEWYFEHNSKNATPPSSVQSQVSVRCVSI